MNGNDVREIRNALGMSQTEFCQHFKINLHTLRQWERKDATLDSCCTAYLHCIRVNPSTIQACFTIMDST